MEIDIYGIANCDTMKKARIWLEAKGLNYRFHDYKKEGVNLGLLGQWCDALGWEALLNRRGTTWRRLDEADREGLNRGKAMELMMAHPSLIKRPVMVVGDCIEAGFSEVRYRELCS